MHITDQIKDILQNELNGAKIEIIDPQNDGVHLEAIVVSNDFLNKSLVMQHRMVMKPLKEAFASSLHALKLTTYTYEKWNQIKESV